MWLLFPINQVIAIAVDTGRRVYKFKKKYLIKCLETNIIDSSGNMIPFMNSKLYWVERLAMLYGEWANKVEISQDVPLNRFISYTLSYMIYLTLLALILIYIDNEIVLYAWLSLTGFYFSNWIGYDISLFLTLKGKCLNDFGEYVACYVMYFL